MLLGSRVLPNNAGHWGDTPSGSRSSIGDKKQRNNDRAGDKTAGAENNDLTQHMGCDLKVTSAKVVAGITAEMSVLDRGNRKYP